MSVYPSQSEYSLAQAQRDLILANENDSYHSESYESGMSDTYLDTDSFEYNQMY